MKRKCTIGKTPTPNKNYPFSVSSFVADMRIADQLLLSPEIDPAIKKRIRESFLINASPVSDYFFTGTDQEVWKIEKDFPNIAPPYELFFLDFVAPEKIVSKVYGIVEWGEHRPTAWGLLCQGMDLDKADDKQAKELKARGARWVLDIHLFFRIEKGDQIRCFGPIWQTQILVQDNGEALLTPDGSDVQMIGMPIGGSMQMIKNRAQRTGETLQECAMAMREDLGPNLQTGLLTLSFLHCKNVAVRVEEDTLSELTYHTIDIASMKRVLKDEGQSDTIGTKRALHICRGHFRHYTNGRKLFGKVEGTFWTPMHSRGIVKDLE